MRRARVIGDKVYLRPFERTDITDDYLEWINDPRVNRHILASGYPVNRDALEAYYESSQPPGCAMFAICDKETDRHIGNGRLSQIDAIHRGALFGWLIGPAEYRGKGYGTDALVQLLRFGFHHLGLNRIWSAVALQNENSIGSIDKVGMTNEGILRQYFFVNGGYIDGVVLSMLREDFDKRHGTPGEWETRGASA
jgi:[ribosomal protein S5]-alanine N-acetyltransferase